MAPMVGVIAVFRFFCSLFESMIIWPIDSLPPSKQDMKVLKNVRFIRCGTSAFITALKALEALLP